jgi:hypothetical protein
MILPRAPIERPKRGYCYFGLWREMKLLTVAEDPQRDRVYRWEDTVLGEKECEERIPLHALLLGEVPGERGITKSQARSGAVAYLEHLWKSYSPHFAPYFIGTPYLRIGFPRERLSMGPRKPLKATAHVQNHSIYCPLGMLYRKTIVHEVCHLLTWRDRHGPEFCAALVHLWEHEFNIRRSRAEWFAAVHGVQIA